MPLHKKKNDMLAKLPAEIILELIRHTHPRSIKALEKALPSARDALKNSRDACFRGMEVEQFQHLSWLVGDSQRRSSSQTQALRDYITTYWESRNAENILRHLDLINQNALTIKDSVMVMVTIQDRVERDTKAFERVFVQKFGGTVELGERTALCLAAFGFKRAEILGEFEQGVDERAVLTGSIPWEERIALFHAQPAETRSEIRFVLQLMVESMIEVCKFTGTSTEDWVRGYYRSGNFNQLMAPTELKFWFATVAVALTMDEVLESWGRGMEDVKKLCKARYGEFDAILDAEVDTPKATEKNKTFQGASLFLQTIGFELDPVLRYTPLEDHLYKMARQMGEQETVVQDENDYDGQEDGEVENDEDEDRMEQEDRDNDF